MTAVFTSGRAHGEVGVLDQHALAGVDINPVRVGLDHIRRRRQRLEVLDPHVVAPAEVYVPLRRVHGREPVDPDAGDVGEEDVLGSGVAVARG